MERESAQGVQGVHPSSFFCCTPKKRENRRDREQVYKVYTYLYKLSFFYKIITDSFFSRRTLCALYTTIGWC